MFEKEFKNITAEFNGILEARNHNWDINQLHAYFHLGQKWDAATAKGLWEECLQNGKGPQAMDLYVHIPFCHSKCSYCPFKSWLYKDKRQVDAYVDQMIEEMHYFQDTFRGRKFHRLLVGGGTPNILTKEQIDRLFSYVFKNFSFTKDARKTFECNPDIVTEADIRMLKKKGFTKLNFGVQSLNPRALETNKRGYQTYQKVKDAILNAKKQGFRHTSVDLIFGLAGDSLPEFAETFARIAELKPADIVIHALKPPDKKYLTDLLKINGKQYFMEHYPQMRDKAFEIIKTLSKKYGYIHKRGGPDPTRWQWCITHKDYADLGRTDRVYTGEYTGCSSILGIGVNARSHIFGIAEYRRIKQAQRFSPREIAYEGKRLERNEEMIKFILNHLDRNSNIPRKTFKRLFRADIESVFPHALYALCCLDEISDVTDDLISFKFPRPEKKYIDALFFLREVKLV